MLNLNLGENGDKCKNFLEKENVNFCNGSKIGKSKLSI